MHIGNRGRGAVKAGSVVEGLQHARIPLALSAPECEHAACACCKAPGAVACLPTLTWRTMSRERFSTSPQVFRASSHLRVVHGADEQGLGGRRATARAGSQAAEEEGQREDKRKRPPDH